MKLIGGGRMKKVFERNTPDGKLEYFEDEKGNVTTAKPVEDVTFKRWIVTDDPSQYTMGRVFTSEEEAVIERVRNRDPEETFIIELSYVSEDLPPQYIHVITSDGTKLRIL